MTETTTNPQQSCCSESTQQGPGKHGPCGPGPARPPSTGADTRGESSQPAQLLGTTPSKGRGRPMMMKLCFPPSVTSDVSIVSLIFLLFKNSQGNSHLAITCSQELLDLSKSSAE